MIFNSGGSAYANLSTPHLYNGMTVRVQGAVRSLTTPASLRLVAFTTDDFGSRASASLASDWTPLAADKPFVASWDIRGCESAAIVSFGFEFASASVCQGVVDVDSVSYDGNASVFHEVATPASATRASTSTANRSSSRNSAGMAGAPRASCANSPNAASGSMRNTRGF